MAFPWVAAGTGTDQELLEIYRAALAQIGVTGQSYAIGSRTLTRADLPEIRETIDWLNKQIAAADPSGGSSETKVNFKRPL